MVLTQKFRAIDSHTGGEPTRVIIDGFPDIGRGSMTERLEIFRRNYDQLRSAIVREPRGHDAVVGALLCDPVDPAATAGVIFFNNVGFLGMCGHGTIGLIKTLAQLDRIGPGKHKIETVVGTVEAELDTAGMVTITNVPSYRYAKDVSVEVEHFGSVTGDVAYGGNWFFLISDHASAIEMRNLARLTDFSVAVRDALTANGITGKDGELIDHIEVFGRAEAADSRNFVLCPGLEYDRSPCGTGTSAKLACLWADGKIKEGEVWRQESIVGSIFEGWVSIENDLIIPSIRSTAHITAELDLIIDERDPFRFGISE